MQKRTITFTNVRDLAEQLSNNEKGELMLLLVNDADNKLFEYEKNDKRRK